MPPNPNTSDRWSISTTNPRACSGGMYAQVPSTLPGRVPRVASTLEAVAAEANSAAGAQPGSGPRRSIAAASDAMVADVRGAGATDSSDPAAARVTTAVDAVVSQLGVAGRTNRSHSRHAMSF